MDLLLQKSRSLQVKIAETGDPSSSAASPPRQFPVEKLNTTVYEVCNPGRSCQPSVEIVFFHGLNLHGSEDAHLRTWLSTAESGSELWLVWLFKEFPEARILLITYNAYIERQSGRHPTDMYLTCEILLQDLREARVGQGDCPVVLVGHCVGCLVMKEICWTLHSAATPHNQEKSLLRNIKGLFYYAGPHLGSRMADESSGFAKAPFFEDLTTLNTEAQRRNEHFRKARSKYRWRTYGIAEGLETVVKGYKGFIVPEAAARSDVDDFYMDVTSDHFSICRPKSTRSSAYRKLSQFITLVLEEDETDRAPNIDIPDDVVGLQEPVKDLIEKLKKEERLALVGMGGIGKTTMAKVLYESIRMSYEYTCFLPDVKKFMTCKEDGNKLRNHIIQGLSRRGHEVDDAFKWKMLKGKTVLIVLDDVEFTSQGLVMLRSDGFGPGSRVIVTSRDRQFLVAEGFHCYSVQPLGAEDSKKLFFLKAWNTDSVVHDYKDLATRCAEKCYGLPLALVVLGRYLHSEKNVEVWNNALNRLKQGKSLSGRREDDLWSVLRLSYDVLEDQEQKMFLDVAVCFHGEKVEDVKHAWRVCGWASDPESGLRNLVDQSWTTIEKGVIRMHEVLRDLGRSIACPNPEDVSGHSRMCYDESNPPPEGWPYDEENSEVQVLKIAGYIGPHIWQLNIQLFNRLRKLRILWVVDYHLKNCPCGLWPPQLASITILSREAVSIWAAFYFLKENSAQRPSGQRLAFTAPSAQQPSGQRLALKHLEVWPGLTGPWVDTLGDLQALQSLVFSLPERHSWLECKPTLRKLHSLRHLQIEGYLDWKGLADTIVPLKALQKIVVRESLDGHDAAEQLAFLASLKRMMILQAPGQVDIPVMHDTLVCWDLSNLSTLPDTLENLQGMLSLGIGNGYGLETLPQSLGSLQALEELIIFNCQRLRVIPSSIGDLSSLRLFDVNTCNGLKALPHSLGNLQALEHLSISSCQNIEVLPSSVGELSSLRRFDIKRCDRLKGLPQSLGNLEALEELSISHCQNVDVLPHTIGELFSLQKLYIIGCDGLKALPQSLGSLQALRELSISHCHNIEVLPFSTGKLSSLRRLDINTCDGLKALPHSLGIFKPWRNCQYPNARI